MSPLAATLQTPPGRGGIAVILLTGAGTREVLADVFRPIRSHRAWAEGALRLGHLMREGEVLDEVVVCEGPGAAEIHIHGGPVVAREVMALLAARGVAVGEPRGAPPDPLARPHPTWDNPAIAREMLAALADARSALVAAALSRQWSGGLSELASHDAAPPEDLVQAADGLTTMQRLLQPAEVVLAGPPNAGKSTLANALVGRAISIVHQTPGTTRDWVRELALLGEGIPVHLTDTAGLWAAPEGVDAEAVRRARARAEAADLVLLLAPGGAEYVPRWLHAKDILRVASQCDRIAPKGTYDLAVSAETGQGMDDLSEAILRRLGLAGLDPAAAMAFTDRQASLLRLAASRRRQGDTNGGRESLDTLLRG